jgi:hypothetical protein
MRRSNSVVLFLFCFLSAPISMGATSVGVTKSFLSLLPRGVRHDYVDACHGKHRLAVFVPKFKMVNGLYFAHNKTCSLRGCRKTAVLSCENETPRIFGTMISGDQFVGYSHDSLCIKTVLTNTKNKFSFEVDCYNSGLNFDQNAHAIHHVIHTVQFIHTGKRSFNKMTTVKMNYPIVFSDVHIYSHYQYRSRSCLVKKLPQLHHG